MPGCDLVTHLSPLLFIHSQASYLKNHFQYSTDFFNSSITISSLYSKGCTISNINITSLLLIHLMLLPLLVVHYSFFIILLCKAEWYIFIHNIHFRRLPWHLYLYFYSLKIHKMIRDTNKIKAHYIYF